jgi:hypothetical protein
LFGAVLLTGRLWIDPAGRLQPGHDVTEFVWFMRYSATAVQHGHLPALVTKALNAPQGVNMMWNTSFLLPGVLLSPVTLLAGPQVSLTLALTLGFAGSAASLFWVLRRWGVSLAAAAIGGAVYGFCPALVDAGLGHNNFQFAVLPPLMIDALARIVTGRGSALRNGAWLGLLAAAQLFTGEELLTDTAVAGVVLVVVLAASRPRAVVDRARGVAAGLGLAAAVALVICWYPLWVQFFGPLAEHHAQQGFWEGNLAFFIDPPGTLVFHTKASAAVATRYSLHLPEYLSYLGWPLIAVLLAAAIWFWRDLRVRACAVTCVLLSLLSLGGVLIIHGFLVPIWLMPFHWLQGMPVVGELLPDRLSIPADGAAAAALAFAVDRARPAVAAKWGAQARMVPLTVAVLAALPLVPLPYQAAPVGQVPAGYQAAFSRLRLAPDAPVLVVPIPDWVHYQAMRWQATTGEPGSLIGGYFLGPGPHGQPSFYITPTMQYLYDLWIGGASAEGPAVSQVQASLASMRPAAVVAVTSQNSALAHVLTGVFGRPSFRVGAVLVWRHPASHPVSRR